jgi:drug/metabolite transporter, DME family
LQSTAPLYLLLIGPLLLKEPLSRSDLLFLGAVAAGMLLCFGSAQPAVATAPDPRTGNLMGAASGLTGRSRCSGLRWLGRREGAGNAATATVVLGNLLAFLVTLPKALPPPHAGLLNFGVLFYLGVFQIGLAYLFVTRAIRHVPAFRGHYRPAPGAGAESRLGLAGAGERPAASSIAGGVLILSATLANAWWQNRRRSIEAILVAINRHHEQRVRDLGLKVWEREHPQAYAKLRASLPGGPLRRLE